MSRFTRHAGRRSVIGGAVVLAVLLGACSDDAGTNSANPSMTPKAPSESSPAQDTPASTAAPAPETPAVEAPAATTDTSAAVPGASPSSASPTVASSKPATEKSSAAKPSAPATSAKPTGEAAAPTGSAPAVGSAPSEAASPAAPAGGNGGATDVGISDTEIKVGAIYMHGMQLGSLITKPMDRTISAQLRVVNDQGGIYGRKFKYISCDDGLPDASRTRACYKKLVEQDKIFAFLGGLTFNSGLLQPFILKDQIPAVAPDSLYRSQWESPWNFPIHMGMEYEARAGGQWVVEVIKPKTVGLLCLNNAEMQATCDASTAVLKANGIQVVHRVNTTAETSDMSGDVLAMRSANPDHIIHYTTHPAATARFMIDAAQQGYWPPKGMSGNHMAGEFVGSLIGDFPAKHGYWTNTTYKLWGPELVSWTRKYTPDNNGLHNHVQQGEWWATNVFVDVLKKMGPKVTRAGLKQQLETGEYVTPPGLGQKFMWSPQGRSAPGTGARREYMYKMTSPDWSASNDGAAAPAGLVPDPNKFVIEAPSN